MCDVSLSTAIHYSRSSYLPPAVPSPRRACRALLACWPLTFAAHHRRYPRRRYHSRSPPWCDGGQLFWIRHTPTRLLPPRYTANAPAHAVTPYAACTAGLPHMDSPCAARLPALPHAKLRAPYNTYSAFLFLPGAPLPPLHCTAHCPRCTAPRTLRWRTGGWTGVRLPAWSSVWSSRHDAAHLYFTRVLLARRAAPLLHHYCHAAAYRITTDAKLLVVRHAIMTIARQPVVDSDDSGGLLDWVQLDPVNPTTPTTTPTPERSTNIQPQDGQGITHATPDATAAITPTSYLTTCYG